MIVSALELGQHRSSFHFDLIVELCQNLSNLLFHSFPCPHRAKLCHLCPASRRDTLELDIKRVTGNKRFTDKLTFTFSDFPGTKPACGIHACSESQVFSLKDFSTNYCNLRILYCGKEDGCVPVKHDLSVSEVKVTPSPLRRHREGCLHCQECGSRDLNCCDNLLLCWVPQWMILWLASVATVLWMTRPCSPAHCVCWKVALAT